MSDEAGGGWKGREEVQGKWIDGWSLCILLFSKGYSQLENGVWISLSKID